MPKNKPYTPNGPIPGENYTSDTKNYPWHRPPEITDMDEAIEKIMKKLATRETSYSMLTVLQAGVPVVTVADIFLTNAIGDGKMTPDMALLLAGPVCHIMKMMAEEYGIKYDMGLDDKAPPTIEFLKAKASIDPKKAVNVADDVSKQIDTFKVGANKIANQAQPEETPQPQTKPMTGLMGMKPPGEDNSMQGM